MPDVLPVMPAYGYGSGADFPGETTRVYEDLSFRSYGRGSAHKIRELVFEELSQQEKDDLEAVILANKNPAAAIYVYDPDVVDAVDLSGVSATGRHSAIITDDGYRFIRDGSCSWSGQITVLFLD